MPARTAPQSKRKSNFDADRRQSRARHATEASATRLHDLVRQRIQMPQAADVDEWEEELERLVDECLENGRDDVLVLALDKLAGDEAALAQLIFYIEDAAANPAVNVDGYLVDASLMAIPLLISSHSTALGGRFERSANFEALCNSTRRAGLVDSGESVFFVNYLYHPKELAEMPPSQVSHLAQFILDARAGGDRIRPTKLGQRGWPKLAPLPDGASTVLLGYLLAVVLDDPKASRIAAGTEESAVELRQAQADRWRGIADPLVAGALGAANGAAHVLGFEPFYHGLRDGLKAFLDMGLHCELAGALVERGMPPKMVSVVISAHGDKSGVREVRVLASSRLDGAPLLGHVLPVGGIDDAFEAFSRIGQCLRAAGVEEVSIVPQVRPMVADGSEEEALLAAGVEVPDFGEVSVMPEQKGSHRLH
jgi:hypothetical protein